MVNSLLSRSSIEGVAIIFSRVNTGGYKAGIKDFNKAYIGKSRLGLIKKRLITRLRVIL